MRAQLLDTDAFVFKVYERLSTWKVLYFHDSPEPKYSDIPLFCSRRDHWS